MPCAPWTTAARICRPLSRRAGSTCTTTRPLAHGRHRHRHAALAAQFRSPRRTLRRRPLARLDADVVTILRLSLYQLLHLTRVPASAVVDDAVDLARLARKQSATGFVNAVLRTTLRQKHRLDLPARPADPSDTGAALAYLGITHSHPDWLIARWLRRYGFDATERWVQFNNEAPPLTLRVNRLRATREEARQTLEGDGVETALATQHLTA
jgi:hypothetical protein